MKSNHQKAAESYSEGTLRAIIRDLLAKANPDMWDRERLAALEAELKRRTKP